MKEEIKKMFRRIELDKSNDSCGFEFADGFSCTFDNIATCYDDRLKLYDLVKDLQSQLKAKEDLIKEVTECIKNFDYYDGEISDDIENIPFKYVIDTDIEGLLEILSKGENK